MKHEYFAFFEKKFLFHQEKHKIEQISKRNGLPRWLSGKETAC